jgi:hypothetical protein
MPADDCPAEPAWLAKAHPHVLAVYRYWKSKCAGRLMPARADLDPLDLVPYLPSIMLIDVRPVEAGSDAPRYIYRLVGTCEVEMRGEDPTGKPVATHGHGLDISYVLENYDHTADSRAPWIDFYETISTDRGMVERDTVFLPLSAKGSDVDMILVYTVHERLADQAYIL